MNPIRTRPAALWLILGGLAALSADIPAAFGTLNLKVGDAMPAFALPRADRTPGTYGLEQLKGQPAVVMFWRPNQKLSLEALHDLQALVQEIGPQRAHFVAVDGARSSAEEVSAALAGENLSFPVLLDPQRELYGQVGVIVCPTTLVLDAQGVLQYVLASHPPQFSQVIRARLRYLLGDIDELEMNREIEPIVLKIDQDLAAAWRMYNLGQKLQAEGKSEEAVTVYEKAVAEYPSLPETRCALGFMKLAAGDLVSAGEQFQTALTYEPASPTARLGQAAVLARTGQPRQAEHILLSLLGQKSNAGRVRYELGRLYYARGELAKAVTFYQDALATLFPEPGLAAAGTAPPTEAAAAPRPPVEAPPLPPGPTAARASAAPDAVPPSAAPAMGQQSGAIEAVVPPTDAEYVGIKQCKKCHLQQWKAWQETKMAKALTVLAPGASAELKRSHNLDPQKDYSTDSQCLTCHSTGFGRAGGYRVPSPGDAGAARVAEETAGVACESCHGPGSKFVPLHKDIQDKKRPYTQDELYAVGEFRVDAHVCAACHDERAPCIGSGYVFDFEQRKEQGTHKHFDLQFRSK
jgi:tetratricopeptide (TPR) repeat protein